VRENTPTVRLIASPLIQWDAVHDYMLECDGMPWLNRVYPGLEKLLGRSQGKPTASDAELLVEYAGRRCYRSWAPGLNANVTKVREDSGSYLENILRSKHGAVLEHAQFTFDFDQVSRVFTHELVRHRAGVAISQESLRYVRLTDLGFRVPEILKNPPDGRRMNIRTATGGALEVSTERAVISLVERLEEFQLEAAQVFGLDDDGVPFHYKKEVTSALRRLAPLGLSTGMVWSANVRTLRHVIAQRTAQGAEEEIRIVFGQVAEIMKTECPLLFGDFSKIHATDDDSIGEYVPEFEKV
jgi:thymidylate synthase (FAD)